MSTKSVLVNEIAASARRHPAEVKPFVQLVINRMLETLMRDGRLELRGFGVFVVKSRKARKARNPRTEELVQVPDRRVICFKPGKFMKDRVNGLAPPAEILSDGVPASNRRPSVRSARRTKAKGSAGANAGAGVSREATKGS